MLLSLAHPATIPLQTNRRTHLRHLTQHWINDYYFVTHIDLSCSSSVRCTHFPNWCNVITLNKAQCNQIETSTFYTLSILENPIPKQHTIPTLKYSLKLFMNKFTKPIKPVIFYSISDLAQAEPSNTYLFSVGLPGIFPAQLGADITT